MKTARDPIELLSESPVLVQADHLVYRCSWDASSGGWRCGRCEVGTFMPRDDEPLPAPGRVCGVCRGTVCLLTERHSFRRYAARAAVLVLVSSWPVLLIWALIG
jgi:hypothetical protein